VVLEYAAARLIDEVASEIEEGRHTLLIEHGLELATSKDYVRQTQQRLLVAPLLVQLRQRYQAREELEQRLLSLLSGLRERADYAQGYGPANVLTLLRLHRGHLSHLDLSRLALRGLNMQGVAMQDTSLAQAMVRDSLFTEPFDAITALAINAGGDLLATASSRGEIRIWSVDSAAQVLSLRYIWRGHSDIIWTLVFSPDGSELASGSWDGAVRLWRVADTSLRWSAAHTSHVN